MQNFFFDVFNKLMSLYKDIFGNLDDVTRVFILSIAVLFFILFFAYSCILIFDLIKINIINRKINAFKNKEKSKEDFDAFFKHKYRIISNNIIENNGKLFLSIDIESIIEYLYYPSILRSYIFPTGAVLLTGLGVLGTFLGLSYGLNDLNFDNSDVYNLQKQIGSIAKGASTAFITSVFGVGFSLILNFVEKIYCAITSSQYDKLKKSISDKFPLFEFNDVALELKSEARKSTDILGTLAEQIGNNVQNSLDSFSEKLMKSLNANIIEASSQISTAIETSLSKTVEEKLVPSIDKMSNITVDLASRQAKGSEQALENLLEKFTGRMNEEGNLQREALRDTSKEMQSTMALFSKNMEQLINNLYEQQSKIDDKNLAQISSIDEILKNIRNDYNNNIEKTNGAMLEALNTFFKNIDNSLKDQSNAITIVSKNINDSLGSTSYFMNEFYEKLNNNQSLVAEEQSKRNIALEQQMKQFLDHQSSSIVDMGEVVKSYMQEASNNILSIIEDFKNKAGDEFNRQTKEMTKTSDNVQKSIQDMSINMGSFFKDLKDYQTNVIDVQSKNQESIENIAKDMFEKQKDSILKIENIVNSHVDATESLIAQGKQIQQNVDNNENVLKDISSKLYLFGKSIEESSEKMKSFSENIEKSFEINTSNIEKTTNIMIKINNFEEKVSFELQNTLRGIREIRDSFESVTNNLNSAIDISRTGFNSLSDNYLKLQDNLNNYIKEIKESASSEVEQLMEVLQKQVEELDMHMGKILKEYSVIVNSQINDRMNEWNNHTKEFCERMKTTVEAMAEVVDSIEVNIGKPSRNFSLKR